MSPFWWVLVFYITCLTKNFQQILTQLNKLVFLCMSNSKKKLFVGPWTKEEDEKVIELVKKHGPKRWTLIARQLKVIRGTVNRFIIISFTGINVNKSSAWINIWINYFWNNLWKALSSHTSVASLWKNLNLFRVESESSVVSAGTTTSTQRSRRQLGPRRRWVGRRFKEW